ncbi:MAG: TIGR03862 family flavoprotein [Pseudomonadota bacterium]
MIVGGGPAGLMAADTVSAAGHDVLLIDRMPSLGRKFLMAGKSGLNLTMDQPLSEFLKAYSYLPVQVHRAVSDFGPKKVQKFARDLGQEVFTGTSRRVFPKLMKASPLLRTWLLRLSEQNLRFMTRAQWYGYEDGRHRVAVDGIEQTITARTVIFAMGGGSWSRLGSNGAWHIPFQNLGIETMAFHPSNSGVRIDWSDYMRDQLGQPLKGVKFSAGGQHLAGEAVITARGLEGTAIYNATPALRKGARLRLDLMPKKTAADLTSLLSGISSKLSRSNKLRRIGLNDTARALLSECAELSADPAAIARQIKKLDIPITGLAPLDEAISTAGGLKTDNLDETLMHPKYPGWFFAGEMMNWDAPTGGYLLTACFATGHLAGANASAFLQSKR